MNYVKYLLITSPSASHPFAALCDDNMTELNLGKTSLAVAGGVKEKQCKYCDWMRYCYLRNPLLLVQYPLEF